MFIKLITFLSTTCIVLSLSCDAVPRCHGRHCKYQNHKDLGWAKVHHAPHPNKIESSSEEDSSEQHEDIIPQKRQLQLEEPDSSLSSSHEIPKRAQHLIDAVKHYLYGKKLPGPTPELDTLIYQFIRTEPALKGAPKPRNNKDQADSDQDDFEDSDLDQDVNIQTRFLLDETNEDTEENGTLEQTHHHGKHSGHDSQKHVPDRKTGAAKRQKKNQGKGSKSKGETRRPKEIQEVSDEVSSSDSGASARVLFPEKSHMAPIKTGTHPDSKGLKAPTHEDNLYLVVKAAVSNAFNTATAKHWNNLKRILPTGLLFDEITKEILNDPETISFLESVYESGDEASNLYNRIKIAASDAIKSVRIRLGGTKKVPALFTIDETLLDEIAANVLSLPVTRALLAAAEIEPTEKIIDEVLPAVKKIILKSKGDVDILNAGIDLIQNLLKIKVTTDTPSIQERQLHDHDDSDSSSEESSSQMVHPKQKKTIRKDSSSEEDHPPRWSKHSKKQTHVPQRPKHTKKYDYDSSSEEEEVHKRVTKPKWSPKNKKDNPPARPLTRKWFKEPKPEFKP